MVVMQYTGLKDKNGKEIYIGDFVAEVRYGEKIIFEVKECEDYLCFYFDNPVYGHYKDNSSNLEVIGNRFELPSLIKS